MTAFQSFAFVLAVPDLGRTTAYFQTVLGFTAHWTDATDWRLLSRGQVNLMIGHCPNTMPARDTGDHSYFGYIQVEDIDALYTEFHGRGATIRQPPSDMPWGQREMLVETPDGHRIMFGQQLPPAASLG